MDSGQPRAVTRKVRIYSVGEQSREGHHCKVPAASEAFVVLMHIFLLLKVTASLRVRRTCKSHVTEQSFKFLPVAVNSITEF